MPVTPLPRIVSPDDHVITHADVWAARLPSRYRDAGPRIVRQRGVASLSEGWITFTETDDGSPCDAWRDEDRVMPTLKMTVAAGLPQDQVDASPVTFDDMHKACYDPQARLQAMDEAGVEASVCFPNMFVRFCGQTFLYGKDKDLALLCVRAYNDFIAEEWCAGSGGRLVPMGIVPLWDPDLAVAEVERNAARGFRAVTFSEAPHLLGLPSIFSGHWERFFAACAATRTVVSMHIGSGGFPMIAPDAPGAIQNVVPALNSAHALTDLLFSGLLARHPALKVSLAESQAGWIPYLLHRADTVWDELGGFSNVSKAALPERPSHYFANQVFVTFFKDAVGLDLLERIGAGNVMYEVDFPHQDSSWPNSHAYATEITRHLSRDDAARLVAGNARELFRL